MQTHLLILGGTTEATALAHHIAKTDVKAIISYAGRVERIRPQPIEKRIGGFGGVEGLARYITENQISHIIDATHPFAAQMSQNAYDACQKTQTPLAALTRPAWEQQPGDNWHHVADISGAVEALEKLSDKKRRIMLAIGRMHIDQFTGLARHFYLLRLVDAPETMPDFTDFAVEVSRGPFTFDADKKLLELHHIDLVISKNAGGKGAYAKIEAARALGLEVIMIDRPNLPSRDELHSPEDVLNWLKKNKTD